MSAIFGIINKKGLPVDKEMIDKMQSSLLHRAVDGKNVYSNDNIMFGHHKLIVHRRQANEQQPLEMEDFAITCDARIDNIDELFQELNLIKSPKTFTDPFIILQAYKKWDNDCVNHLEGEFCFAIWDKKKKQFFGASDHIGFRTFYYYENQNFFAFASEIKAIESVKSEPLNFNEEILIDFYTNYHQPITYDKNIQILQSAHILILENNWTISKIHYWNNINNNYKKYNFKHSHDYNNCLLELMTRKIKAQIDSEYPIGILLSGGLDSSFVAALACKLLKQENRKLYAFCSVLPEGYQGPDKDERFYIEKLREEFDNLEVHYVTVPDDLGPYSNLIELFNRIEEPVTTFHYVHTALYESARKLNVRTLLTGFGGDITISVALGNVIFQYLLDGKILKALVLFINHYKFSNKTILRLLKTEILQNFLLYRKVSKLIYKKRLSTQCENDPYKYYLLKEPFVKKVLKKSQSNSLSYKKEFLNRLNQGEIGSTLMSLKKYAVFFNLDFLSPILDKNICELFLNTPYELFNLNGVERSLIKETMKNIVPLYITSRNDKMPFSPDYNKRIALITTEYLQHYIISKESAIDTPGIDFTLLFDKILKIKSDVKSTFTIKKDIYYIPFAVIIIEFFSWLNNKKSRF